MLPLPLPSSRHCQPWLTPRALRYPRVQGSRILDIRSSRRRVCRVSWYWLPISGSCQGDAGDKWTRALNRLLGRADEDLVDAHPLGLGHGVDYGVRDVFCLQPLQVHEAAKALAGVLVCDVIRELGVNGPWPDDRHADVVFQELLS